MINPSIPCLTSGCGELIPCPRHHIFNEVAYQPYREPLSTTEKCDRDRCTEMVDVPGSRCGFCVTLPEEERYPLPLISEMQK